MQCHSHILVRVVVQCCIVFASSESSQLSTDHGHVVKLPDVRSILISIHVLDQSANFTIFLAIFFWKSHVFESLGCYLELSLTGVAVSQLQWLFFVLPTHRHHDWDQRYWMSFLLPHEETHLAKRLISRKFADPSVQPEVRVVASRTLVIVLAVRSPKIPEVDRLSNTRTVPRTLMPVSTSDKTVEFALCSPSFAGDQCDSLATSWPKFHGLGSYSCSFLSEFRKEKTTNSGSIW